MHCLVVTVSFRSCLEAITRDLLKFHTNCSMSEGNEFYTEWTESYESFDQMNLHENLLRGIYAYGAYSKS